MANLLYVIAHPGTVENSQTLKASEAFVEEWKKLNADGNVTTINLFEEEPPYYTQAHFNLISKEKFSTISGQELTADEQKEFARYAKYMDSFMEADVVVFANPMWNHFLPAELKQYLDLIQVSGKSFRYTAQGPVGLLSDKEVVHVQAAGGFYHNDPEVAKNDMGSAYIDFVMNFIGLNNAHPIYIEGAAFVPDQAQAIMDNAIDEARSLAAKLSK